MSRGAGSIPLIRLETRRSLSPLVPDIFRKRKNEHSKIYETRGD